MQRFIEYFEKVERPADDSATKANPTEGMTPEQRLHWRILHRHKDGVEADIDEILAHNGKVPQHQTAVGILNEVLLPAMKEVGDKFGAGELILPFVLQSAEVMKKAVSHVEQFLEKKEGTSKGRVVLATVYGDVHDIGKNLVKTILSNNGYEVVDLGKQVPAETIISKAVEVEADAIGLSALLVNTSKQMPLIINELARRGIEVPGAGGRCRHQPPLWLAHPVHRRRRTLRTRCVLLQRRLRRPGGDGRPVGSGPAGANRGTPAPGGRTRIRPASQPPAPNPGVALFRHATGGVHPPPTILGARVVRQMPLEIIFKHLFKNELFRLSWGAKNAHGEEWKKLQAEFEARLERMQRQARREGWLQPRAVYGYWPAQADGDDLIVYDPATLRPRTAAPAELMRFQFPRQPYSDFLCLADYFAPAGSGKMDVVAFQVVTVGQEATIRIDDLQAAGDYAEAYYTHGLAVQTAEATAEYLHRHIRRELGLAEEQGKRYSWGYPAIPELSDHRKVFDLLPAEEELGMKLTAAYQLVPEQSTAAIIVHHPQAKYFSVGESRVEQLLKN